MESVVETVVRKIRRERLQRIRPLIRTSGKSVNDTEAILRRCKSCSNAAIHLQEIPCSPFKNLEAYERDHLARAIAGTERCSACQATDSEFVASLYCQYRRKSELDCHLMAFSERVKEIFLVDSAGHIWPADAELGRGSIDTAIQKAQRPSDCERIPLRDDKGSGKESAEARLRHNVQRILMEFEENRIEDPMIFGPSHLPLSIIEDAASFAEVAEHEVPLVFIGTNKRTPGREGLLLTDARLYSSDLTEKALRYPEIKSVEIRKGLLGSSVFVNGHRILPIRGFKEPNAKLISFVLKRLSTAHRAPPKRSDKPPVKGEGKKNGELKKAPRRPEKAERALPRHRPSHPITRGPRSMEAMLGLPEDKLRHIFGGLAERKVAGDLVHVFEIPDQLVQSARRFAKIQIDERPVAHIKSDLGESPSRMLITDLALYTNAVAVLPLGIRYNELEAVDLVAGEGGETLEINGHPFLRRGQLPDWFLPKILDCLSLAADETDQGEPEEHEDEGEAPGPEGQAEANQENGADVPAPRDEAPVSRIGRRMRGPRDQSSRELPPPPAPPPGPAEAAPMPEAPAEPPALEPLPGPQRVSRGPSFRRRLGRPSSERRPGFQSPEPRHRTSSERRAGMGLSGPRSPGVNHSADRGPRTARPGPAARGGRAPLTRRSLGREGQGGAVEPGRLGARAPRRPSSGDRPAAGPMLRPQGRPPQGGPPPSRPSQGGAPIRDGRSKTRLRRGDGRGAGRGQDRRSTLTNRPTVTNNQPPANGPQSRASHSRMPLPPPSNTQSRMQIPGAMPSGSQHRMPLDPRNSTSGGVPMRASSHGRMPTAGRTAAFPRPRGLRRPSEVAQDAAPGIDPAQVPFAPELIKEANNLWLSGRLEEALPLLEDALGANPLNPSLTYGYAALLAGLQDDIGALDTLLQALRFGFRDKRRLMRDPSWARMRNDIEFLRIGRRLDLSRDDDATRLEHLSRGYAYFLEELSFDLPAEVRVTSCRSCGDVQYDPARPDYDFLWRTAEGFHLEAIAPLALEQLPCNVCEAYAVEILGTVHAFPLSDGNAVHLIYWLDNGATRARFIFQTDPEGRLSELRTYYILNNARFHSLGAENDSLIVRLGSPHPEVVECAVRDLGVPGNIAALPSLGQQLEKATVTLDDRGRCDQPWLAREILETFVAIGSPKALDHIFAALANILTHESIDEAFALSVADASVQLGGAPMLSDLLRFVQDTARNASPYVIEGLALAIIDAAESQGDFQAADEGRILIDRLGIH